MAAPLNEATEQVLEARADSLDTEITRLEAEKVQRTERLRETEDALVRARADAAGLRADVKASRALREQQAAAAATPGQGKP